MSFKSIFQDVRNAVDWVHIHVGSVVPDEKYNSLVNFFFFLLSVLYNHNHVFMFFLKLNVSLTNFREISNPEQYVI